ncbi:G2/mitotic-specific cyclin [Sorochytrium milnesiophthora]
MASMQTRAARLAAAANQENEMPHLQAGKQHTLLNGKAVTTGKNAAAVGALPVKSAAAMSDALAQEKAALAKGGSKIPKRQPLAQKGQDAAGNVKDNVVDDAAAKPTKTAAVTRAARPARQTSVSSKEDDSADPTAGRRTTRSRTSQSKDADKAMITIEVTSAIAAASDNKENQEPRSRKRPRDASPKAESTSFTAALKAASAAEDVHIVDADRKLDSVKRRKFEEQEKLKTFWEEMEAEDLHDPAMCAEYASEIMEYMMQTERTMLPDPNYIMQHRELDWRMRTILVDWIIEVHFKFKMTPETLFLAINIMDRFLSRRVCALAKLQLVGLTALFIAAKYEEVLSPPISQFVYMADNTYKEDEILKAERYILRVLDWAFNFPNPLNFLRRASKADNYDVRNRTVAKYLMEITLLSHEFLEYEPSRCAAAALYVARYYHTGDDTWDATYEKFSGYSEEDVRQLGQLICNSLAVSREDTFLYKKYASKRFGKASVLMSEFVKEVAASHSPQE